VAGSNVPWLKGLQLAPVWTAADTEAKTLGTLNTPENYDGALSVSCHGQNVQFDFQMGTSGAIFVPSIRAPFTFCVPGGSQIEARKIDPAAAAWARLAVGLSSSGRESFGRVAQSAAGASPSQAIAVTALAASNITVDGTAVALAAGQRLVVVQPVTFVAGHVIWEIAL
jgi:hypothetical protein